MPAQKSQVRAAREFDEGQANSPHSDLICADSDRRGIALRSGGGDDVVLVYAVAADADCAHQHSVLVQRDAARKNLCPVRKFRYLCAWHTHSAESRQQVRLNQIKLKADVEDAPFRKACAEGAWLCVVDAVWEERAMKETD